MPASFSLPPPSAWQELLAKMGPEKPSAPWTVTPRPRSAKTANSHYVLMVVRTDGGSYKR